MLSQGTELCHETMVGGGNSSMGPWTAIVQHFSYLQSSRYPKSLGAHKTPHPLIPFKCIYIYIYMYGNDALTSTDGEQGLALG